jgi:hypothetical protein
MGSVLCSDCFVPSTQWVRRVKRALRFMSASFLVVLQSDLKSEAVNSYETSVNLYENTDSHITEGSSVVHGVVRTSKSHEHIFLTL